MSILEIDFTAPIINTVLQIIALLFVASVCWMARTFIGFARDLVACVHIIAHRLEDHLGDPHDHGVK